MSKLTICTLIIFIANLVLQIYIKNWNAVLGWLAAITVLVTEKKCK
jgi:hypothetical protein